MKVILAAAVTAGCVVFPAMAQEGKWTGEGSLSAGLNTGNTETSDVGIGVKMSHETQIWNNSFELIADYGTQDGTETKNRAFIAGQSNRTLSDRLFAFGRVSHEVDEFSGFEIRSFAGGGLGWQVFEDGPFTWSVEGGPGIKFDRIKASMEGVPPVMVPARSDESFSVIAASRAGLVFNDAVKLGNDTNLIYADTSTQIGNKTTLTALLTKRLSARVSFEVRHDTDPQPGFEPTDTASRFSLVYAFGD